MELLGILKFRRRGMYEPPTQTRPASAMNNAQNAKTFSSDVRKGRFRPGLVGWAGSEEMRPWAVIDKLQRIDNSPG
jgi:hypothetical protein